MDTACNAPKDIGTITECADKSVTYATPGIPTTERVLAATEAINCQEVSASSANNLAHLLVHLPLS